MCPSTFEASSTFKNLAIHDEDGSRAAPYRGAVLVLRARAFGPALRVGNPGKLIGPGGNRE